MFGRLSYSSNTAASAASTSIPRAIMKAAFYRQQGPADKVLEVGEFLPVPQPGPGEVRVRLATSGVNPSDVKSRSGRFAPMAFPMVVPHSDGAGVIDAVGAEVEAARVGQRVWTYNAYRQAARCWSPGVPGQLPST